MEDASPSQLGFTVERLDSCRGRLYPRKRAGTILQETGWASELVWTGGITRPQWNSIPDRRLYN